VCVVPAVTILDLISNRAAAKRRRRDPGGEAQALAAPVVVNSATLTAVFDLVGGTTLRFTATALAPQIAGARPIRDILATRSRDLLMR